MADKLEPPEVHYLQPGALYAGRRPLWLRTVLGSCVAVTLWHRPTGMAAMCHYVLPQRPRNSVSKAPRDCDGRYGDDALQFLFTAASSVDGQFSRFQVGLFGGAALARDSGLFRIGANNIELAERQLQQWGFRVHHVDVAGRGGRMIQLDSVTGELKVRYHVPPGIHDDRISTLGDDGHRGGKA